MYQQLQGSVFFDRFASQCRKRRNLQFFSCALQKFSQMRHRGSQVRDVQFQTCHKRETKHQTNKPCFSCVFLGNHATVSTSDVFQHASEFFVWQCEKHVHFVGNFSLVKLFSGA